MKKILVRFWKEWVIMIFLISMLSAINVFSSLIQGEIITTLVRLNYDLFVKKLIYLIIIFGCLLIFTYLKIRYQSLLTQKIIGWLREELAKNLIKLDFTSYHHHQSSTYISWMTQDINLIEEKGLNPFYDMVSGIITVIFSIIGLLTLHWSLILLSICWSLIMINLPKIFNREIEEKSIRFSRENESFLSKVSDVIIGHQTLFIFNKLGNIVIQVRESSEELSKEKNNYIKTMAKVAIISGLGNVMSQVSIMGMAGYLAIRQIIFPGMIVSAGGLGSEIFNTLGNLSPLITNVKSVNPIFEKFESLKDLVKNQKNGRVDKANNTVFQFEHVFVKMGQQEILQDMNFEIKLGDKVAIIGPSGSGKSTLLDIMSGLLEGYSGEVKLLGESINHLKPYDIFEHVCYLNQEPYIFNKTIKENITLGDIVTDEEVYGVLDKVKLLDHVRSLPKALDSELGEKGKNFSGGQLQRLAIARGLLQRKTVFLLDESTSKLDKATSNFIEEYLLTQKEYTCIMVSHHLDEDKLRKFDQVIQLQ